MRKHEEKKQKNKGSALGLQDEIEVTGARNIKHERNGFRIRKNSWHVT